MARIEITSTPVPAAVPVVSALDRIAADVTEKNFMAFTGREILFALNTDVGAPHNVT